MTPKQAPRQPLTFAQWKKAMMADGWFRKAADYHRAVGVVFNAYISLREGELTQRGCEAAINWAFDLNHGAALHETRRAQCRNFYKKVVDTTESVT